MTQNPLMGTICGDIIGVPYEHPAENRIKHLHFPYKIEKYLFDSNIFYIFAPKFV